MAEAQDFICDIAAVRPLVTQRQKGDPSGIIVGRVWRGRRLYVVRRSFVLAVCPRVRDAFEAACRAAFKAEARRGEGDAPAAPTVARCSPAELNALKSQGACPAAAQCLDLVCFAFARGTAEALLTAGGGASASSAAAGAGGGAVVAGGAAADKLRELSIFANACAVLSYVGPLPLPECFMPGGMGDGAEGGEDDDDPVETADDAAWADELLETDAGAAEGESAEAISGEAEEGAAAAAAAAPAPELPLEQQPASEAESAAAGQPRGAKAAEGSSAATAAAQQQPGREEQAAPPEEPAAPSAATGERAPAAVAPTAVIATLAGISRPILSPLDKPPHTGGLAFEAQAAEVGYVLQAKYHRDRGPKKQAVGCSLNNLLSAQKRAVAFARDRAGPWHGVPTPARLRAEQLGLLVLVDGPTILAYADHLLRLRSCTALTTVKNLGLLKDVIEVIRNRFFLENTLVHQSISALVRDIDILMAQLHAAATSAPKGIKPRLADLVAEGKFVELADGVERICKYADQVLAEDDRVGSMKTALAVRDVAIAMLAVNDAFPNQRPLEFTGALDRRLPGGNKCIMDKLCPHGGCANKCPGPGFTFSASTDALEIESYHGKTVRSAGARPIEAGKGTKIHVVFRRLMDRAAPRIRQLTKTASPGIFLKRNGSPLTGRNAQACIVQRTMKKAGFPAKFSGSRCMRQAYGHAFVTYQAELTPGERRDLPAAAGHSTKAVMQHYDKLRDASVTNAASAMQKILGKKRPAAGAAAAGEEGGGAADAASGAAASGKHATAAGGAGAAAAAPLAEEAGVAAAQPAAAPRKKQRRAAPEPPDAAPAAPSSAPAAAVAAAAAAPSAALLRAREKKAAEEAAAAAAAEEAALRMARRTVRAVWGPTTSNSAEVSVEEEGGDGVLSGGSSKPRKSKKPAQGADTPKGKRGKPPLWSYRADKPPFWDPEDFFRRSAKTVKKTIAEEFCVHKHQNPGQPPLPFNNNKREVQFALVTGLPAAEYKEFLAIYGSSRQYSIAIKAEEEEDGADGSGGSGGGTTYEQQDGSGDWDADEVLLYSCRGVDDDWADSDLGGGAAAAAGGDALAALEQQQQQPPVVDLTTAASDSECKSGGTEIIDVEGGGGAGAAGGARAASADDGEAVTSGQQAVVAEVDLTGLGGWRS